MPPPAELLPGQPDPAISLAEHEGVLPLEKIFGRRVPLEIEVGAGGGSTLLALGERFPEHDFLGIEVGLSWVRLARTRLIESGLTNVRVVAGEGQWIFERYLPESVASCVHVYFPDPWPKKRHAKRRLFQAGFTVLLRRILKEDGLVRVATDNEPYFREIRQVLDAGGFTEDTGATWSEEPVSAFEAKYRMQGRPILRVAYRP